MRRLFVSLFSGQHRCVKPSWDHETAASNISRICECLSQIISVNPICIGELLSFGLVTSRYGKKHGERFFFFAASTPSLAAFGFSNGYGYAPCLGRLMCAQESTIILPSYYHHITMSIGGMGFRSFLRLFLRFFPRPGRPGRGWQWHWRRRSSPPMPSRRFGSSWPQAYRRWMRPVSAKNGAGKVKIP